MTQKDKDLKQDLSPFMDTQAFWVIWQVGCSPRGEKRFRRISQEYGTQARAEVDAERYRKSGTVTWVEQARPPAPGQVPQAALDAVFATAAAPAKTSVRSIGLAA
jgi:hypothetical protein